MLSQHMLRTCEGKSFFEEKNLNYDCRRSTQMLYTDEINYLSIQLRTYFRVTI